MGVIVLEGIVVTVLVLVGLREAVMNAVPLALKRAIGVGIGLFILFIGFVNGGLIVSRRATDRSRSTFVVPDRRRRQFVFLARPADHDRARARCKIRARADHQHPGHDGHRARRPGVQPRVPTDVRR